MLSISATPLSRLEEVLSLLLGHLSEQEKLVQVKELLDSAKSKQLDLSGLIMASYGSKVCGAALSITQPDQSAFVWSPVVADTADSEEIENQLLKFMGEQLDHQDVWMGQCIVELDARKERQALQRNQFKHIADLVYMQRLLSEPLPDPGTGEELQCVSYTDESSHEKFKEVLGNTYVDTHDCTVLNDLRTLEETLGSHQLAGEFLPAQWKIYQDRFGDAGLLLMNDHLDQDAWEVVYIGVVPKARGKGYGREIILSGLREAKNAGRGQVILAVDVKNSYAYRVYESLGFQETTRKSVHVRLKPGLAFTD